MWNTAPLHAPLHSVQQRLHCHSFSTQSDLHSAVHVTQQQQIIVFQEWELPILWLELLIGKFYIVILIYTGLEIYIALCWDFISSINRLSIKIWARSSYVVSWFWRKFLFQFRFFYFNINSILIKKFQISVARILGTRCELRQLIVVSWTQVTS